MGRVPQEHLTYITGSPDPDNFFREWVGNAGYRVIYEISGDGMVVVRPKDDGTDDLDEFVRRMRRE